MEPKVYHIAAPLRRSATYTLVGYSLVVAVIIWLSQLNAMPNPVGTVIVCGIFSLMALAMIIPIRWALRIDDRGIARRWLFHWDEWSWDDFASGRIEKCGGVTFLDPDRPRLRQRLTIAFLCPADLKEVVRRINEHYRLPPAPACPDSLRVELGPQRSIEFDRGGLRIRAREDVGEYSWEEVSRLRIVRIDPVRRDFLSLELKLPNCEFELNRSRKSRPTFRCSAAKAAEICEFLLAHIPAERVAVDLFDECPTETVDIEKMLARARQKEKEFRSATLILSALMFVWTMWEAFDVGMLRSLAITAFPWMLMAMLWMMRNKIYGAETKKLELWLANRRLGESPVEIEATQAAGRAL